MDLLENPELILVPILLVIGLFCWMAYAASWTDKLRAKARTRCKEIIDQYGGEQVSISEKYKATTREFEYDVAWNDKAGNKHHFKYHPPTMHHREKIVED